MLNSSYFILSIACQHVTFITTKENNNDNKKTNIQKSAASRSNYSLAMPSLAIRSLAQCFLNPVNRPMTLAAWVLARLMSNMSQVISKFNTFKGKVFPTRWCPNCGGGELNGTPLLNKTTFSLEFCDECYTIPYSSNKLKNYLPFQNNDQITDFCFTLSHFV